MKILKKVYRTARNHKLQIENWAPEGNFTIIIMAINFQSWIQPVSASHLTWVSSRPDAKGYEGVKDIILEISTEAFHCLPAQFHPLPRFFSSLSLQASSEFLPSMTKELPLKMFSQRKVCLVSFFFRCTESLPPCQASLLWSHHQTPMVSHHIWMIFPRKTMRWTDFFPSKALTQNTTRTSSLGKFFLLWRMACLNKLKMP